jgi:hypothetical protein
VAALVTHDFDSMYQGCEVRVRYLQEKWVDRTGDVLNIADPRNMHATHHYNRVRLARPDGKLDQNPYCGGKDYMEDENQGMARVECTVSAIFVRWADENCDEVKEGDSGWGPTGAVGSHAKAKFKHEIIITPFAFFFHLYKGGERLLYFILVGCS